jgi:hypothetical protein
MKLRNESDGGSILNESLRLLNEKYSVNLTNMSKLEDRAKKI